MTEIPELLKREANRARPSAIGLERTLRKVGRRRRNRRIVAGVTGVVVATAGLALAYSAIGPPSSEPGDGSRQIECLSPDEPGLLTCREALQRADQEDGTQSSVVEAKLGWYAPSRGGEGLRIWLVTYKDVQLLGSGPPGDGHESNCIIDDWEVAIDARTGEFLVAGNSGEGRPCPSQGGNPVAEVCDFPGYLPTYLPWLEPGDPVPEPERQLTSAGGGPQGLDPGYAILVWGFGDISTPGGPRLEGTLSLWRSTENVGALPIDPAVPRLPDGAQGRFYQGEGEDWSIVWRDVPSGVPYGDPCSETVLGLTMPHLVSAEQREELIKVARSLTSETG